MSVVTFAPLRRRPSLLSQLAALFVARPHSHRRSAIDDPGPALSWPGMAGLSPDEVEAWRPICDVAARLAPEPPAQPKPAPHILDQVMAELEGVSAHHETRDVTVLFADVRGFTSFAEALRDDPRRLADLIGGILDPLSDVVLAHGGVIDKYMGDCVMAFWGAPDDDPDHAAHAVGAARAMLGAMDAVNTWVARAFADLDLPRIEIGIGVNSGECVVGNVGSRRRFDYSVLGDPVNVASRLEGLCKDFGTPLMVGEETARRLSGDAALREIGQVALRGRASRQRVYGLSAA
jgi:adenylate cyclase